MREASIRTRPSGLLHSRRWPPESTIEVAACLNRPATVRIVLGINQHDGTVHRVHSRTEWFWKAAIRLRRALNNQRLLTPIARGFWTADPQRKILCAIRRSRRDCRDSLSSAINEEHSPTVTLTGAVDNSLRLWRVFRDDERGFQNQRSHE